MLLHGLIEVIDCSRSCQVGTADSHGCILQLDRTVAHCDLSLSENDRQCKFGGLHTQAVKTDNTFGIPHRITDFFSRNGKSSFIHPHPHGSHPAEKCISLHAQCHFRHGRIHFTRLNAYGSIRLAAENSQRVCYLSFQLFQLQFALHVDNAGCILRIGRLDTCSQFIDFRVNLVGSQSNLIDLHLRPQHLITDESQGCISGKREVMRRIFQHHLLHIQLSFQFQTAQILLLKGRQPAPQIQIRIHLSA